MAGSVKGLDLVAMNLTALKKEILLESSKKAVRAMGVVALREVKKNVSVRSRTERQLRQLKHPYSKKRGSISLNRHKPYIVQSQSGRLMFSVTGSVKRNISGRFVYRVGFLNGPPHYVRYIISGTRYMHQRDVVYMTVIQKKTKKDMVKAVAKSFSDELKVQAGLQFKVL